MFRIFMGSARRYDASRPPMLKPRWELIWLQTVILYSRHKK
jgi:hypothetical protein